MVPNYLSQVQQARDRYPEAWRSAHVHGDPKAWDFIRLLARDLHAIDPRIGLNGKRGNPNDMSMDALNYSGEGPGHDPTNGNAPITVIDVIGAAGSPAAVAQWVAFDSMSAPGAWVAPAAEAPPVAVPAYPGDQAFDGLSAVLWADYASAGRHADLGMGRWFGRTTYDYFAGMSMEASIAKHRAEWRESLGL